MFGDADFDRELGDHLNRIQSEEVASIEEARGANPGMTREERRDLIAAGMCRQMARTASAWVSHPGWRDRFVGLVGLELINALEAALEDPDSGTTWTQPRVATRYAAPWRWEPDAPLGWEVELGIAEADLEAGAKAILPKMARALHTTAMLEGLAQLTGGIIRSECGDESRLLLPPWAMERLASAPADSINEEVERLGQPFRIGWPRWDVAGGDLLGAVREAAEDGAAPEAVPDDKEADELAADLHTYLAQWSRLEALRDAARLWLPLPPGIPGSFSICLDVDPLCVNWDRQESYFEMRFSIDFDEPESVRRWSRADRARLFSTVRAPFERLIRGEPFFGELQDDAATRRFIATRARSAVQSISDRDNPDRRLTLDQVAQMLGVTERSVRNYLSGETAIPSDKLCTLARRTGRPLEEFFPPMEQCPKCSHWVRKPLGARHCATNWGPRPIGRLIVAKGHVVVEDPDGNPHKVFDGERVRAVRGLLQDSMTPFTEVLELVGNRLQAAGRRTLERLGLEPPAHEILAEKDTGKKLP